MAAQRNPPRRKAADEPGIMPLALRQMFDLMARHFPGHTMQRVLYPDGRVQYTYISPGMRAQLGLDDKQILAQESATHDWIHPDDRARWRAALLASAATLQTLDEEVRVIDRDDRVRWVRSIGNPRRLASGAVVWDGIALDVTDKREALSALQLAKEQADAANAAKSRFVAEASEALKKPLADMRLAMARIEDARSRRGAMAALEDAIDRAEDKLAALAGGEALPARPAQTILLADANGLFRGGILNALASELEPKAIEVESLAELKKATARTGFRCDVAVIDLALPGLTPEAARETLAELARRCALLLISAAPSPDEARLAADIGARGLLPRSLSGGGMLRALQLARDADTVRLLPEGIAPAARSTAPAAQIDASALPKRQRAVLALLGEGLSNRAIGERLGITEGTAKLHVAAIRRRFGLRNRTEAALAATAAGEVVEA